MHIGSKFTDMTKSEESVTRGANNMSGPLLNHKGWLRLQPKALTWLPWKLKG